MAGEPRPSVPRSEERLARALTGDPLTVREAREVLKSLGKRGWRVDAVDRDRFYALSSAVLHSDGRMRPQAKTALLTMGDGGAVEIVIVDGWIVD